MYYSSIMHIASGGQNLNCCLVCVGNAASVNMEIANLFGGCVRRCSVRRRHVGEGLYHYAVGGRVGGGNTQRSSKKGVRVVVVVLFDIL